MLDFLVVVVVITINTVTHFWAFIIKLISQQN